MDKKEDPKNRLITEIDEGYTFNYFLSASALILLGVVFLILLISDIPLSYYGIIGALIVGVIGALSLAIGIIQLLIKSGTIVDGKEKRIGRYDSLFNRKKVAWKSLSECTLATISTTSLSQTLVLGAQSQHIQAKLYQLKFDYQTKKGVFYHEFSDYNTIVLVTNAINKELNIKIQNKVIEAQIEGIKNRKTRARR